MEFCLGIITQGGSISVGPLWFLEVLLIFNIISAILYRIFPTVGEKIWSKGSRFFDRTWLFIITIVLVSSVTYTAMVITFGPFRWISIGPLTFQADRILHYFIYFIMGALAGIYGIKREC